MPHRVRVSDCLNACDRSNLAVVQPTPAARRAGARPVWLGAVLTDDAIDDVADWMNAGGPGASPMPDALHPHAFPAPRWPRHAPTAER